MDRRLELHELLLTMGAQMVAFQPPADVKMVYPAITYERDSELTRFADNAPYRRVKRYLVTVIDRDPDSLIPGRIGDLPLSNFSRHFVVDNLNHDVYTLYF